MGDWTDLLSEAVGGRVVACNDEFFAPASNLVRVETPVWKEGLYTEEGKWMDGWETRRRRTPGHDWCVLALGIPGRIRSVTVDTAHFTGNYPEAFALWGCAGLDEAEPDAGAWIELIPRTSLQGDSVATFDVDDPHRITHLRLDIHPDGGVARLGVFGDPIPGRDLVCGEVDLASGLVGGRGVEASDAHYGSVANLVSPGDPRGMWDGWETRRRRGPGHDWAVVSLGLPGVVDRFDVDTRWFRGNAPGSVVIEGRAGPDEAWKVIATADVSPDSVNAVPVVEPARVAEVRLQIHPDGGVARLRAWGRADRDAAGALMVGYVNSLPPDQANSFFHAACVAGRWVGSMVDRRPFADPTELLAEAERSFDELSEADWIEAFGGHPRIGERSGDAVASHEQTGTSDAAVDTLEALAGINARYEQRFGFTYIVYATGRSAEEMLAIARERIDNDRAAEIDNASAAQRRITQTRLRRMLCLEAS